MTTMIKITRRASDRKQALSTAKHMEALGGQRIETLACGGWESKDGDSIFPRGDGLPVLGWKGSTVRAVVDGQGEDIRPLEKSRYSEAGYFAVSCWLPDYA